LLVEVAGVSLVNANTQGERTYVTGPDGAIFDAYFPHERRRQ
jgi:hypothetical protein